MHVGADLPVAPLTTAFTDPVGYSTVWVVLAVVAVGLVVAWVVGVLWATRTRPESAPRVAPDDLEGQRHEALAAIDALAAALARREVTTRDAAGRLSAVVREFVGAATGLALRTMTLEDLQGTRVPQLTELVTVLYPSEFGPQETEVGPLVERGRELVATWR